MHFNFSKAGLMFIALLTVVPCAHAACTGPQQIQTRIKTHPDAAAYTQLGNWFGDRNQFDCAVESYRSALKLEPGSAELSYLLGLSLFYSGNAQDAVEPLQQAVQLMPEISKPHLILAAVFLQLQKPDDAKNEYEEALKIDPHSIDALKGMSQMLLAQQNYGAVVGLLHSAPPNEDLSVNLAVALGKLRMTDDAEKVLKEALRLHPASLQLTETLTTILVQQTHYQEAVELSRKCALAHPRDLEAQRLYLRVLVVNDSLDVARPLGKKLLAQAPNDFDFLYLNGIMERQAGQYTEARDHLEKAVALNPDYYNSRYNLGVVLNQLKDYAGARDQLEKAIALGAKEPEVRFELATSLRNLGDMPAAQEQLKLYQKESQEKANRVVAAGKSAQAEKELAAGDSQKAAELYKEAVNATPDDPMLNFKLALALDRTGDTNGESAALDKAIQLDPSLALAQNQIGYLASRNGDFATAEQHFKLALQAAPGYAEAWVNLAAALGMESKLPEAQEAVANALKIDPQNSQALQLRQSLTNAQTQQR